MIKDHRYYWLGFAVFLFITAIILLLTDKGDVLFFFNQYRTALSVYFFRFMSYIVEYPIFILLCFGFLFYSYRTSILIGTSGIVGMIVVGGLKLFFGQPRPRIYYSELEFIDILQYLENYEPLVGYTSFPSGHTTAAFILFTSLAIAIKRNWTDVIFIILAILSAISRVFLANHFLVDIFAGSILGVGITIFINYLLTKINVKEQRSILDK